MSPALPTDPRLSHQAMARSESQSCLRYHVGDHTTRTLLVDLAPRPYPWSACDCPASEWRRLAPALRRIFFLALGRSRGRGSSGRRAMGQLSRWTKKSDCLLQYGVNREKWERGCLGRKQTYLAPETRELWDLIRETSSTVSFSRILFPALACVPSFRSIEMIYTYSVGRLNKPWPP